MLELPTRIGGVQISRQGAAALHPTNPALRQPDRGRTWPAGRFRQQLAVEAGLTCEPNYTRHPSLQREIRVVQGEVFVVAVDIRLGSPTFGQWQGFYLRAADGRRLLIPAGVACGWQSVSDASVEQRASHRVQPHHWRWLRWNDPLLSIQWPATPRRLRHHPRPSCWLSSLPETELPNRERLNDPTDADRGQQVRSIRLSTPPGERQLREPSAAARTGMEFVSFPAAGGTYPGAGQPKPTRSRTCLRLRPWERSSPPPAQPAPRESLPRPLQVELHRPASLRQVLPSSTQPGHPRRRPERSGTGRDHPRLAQLVNATAAHIIAEECEPSALAWYTIAPPWSSAKAISGPWQSDEAARSISSVGPSSADQRGSANLFGGAWCCGQLAVRRGRSELHYQSGRPTDLSQSDPTGQRLSGHTDQPGLAGGVDRPAPGERPKLDHPVAANPRRTLPCSPLGYASRLEVADHVLNICRLLTCRS